MPETTYVVRWTVPSARALAEGGIDDDGPTQVLTPAAPAATSVRMEARVRFHPYHCVLLVDDDIDILDAFGTVLELSGVHVDRAQSAFTARGKLLEGGRPCLILLDIRMPGMTGYDLLAWMQRDRDMASIPVVLISGEPQSRAESEERGVKAFLRKPVDVDQVMRLVDRYCANAAPSR